MKLALSIALALAALTGPAYADDADKVREASKAETETFNMRMYAGSPGANAYACFVRRYDAGHLAQHPKQKVAAMKLLISAELDNEDKQLHNSFRLGFKYRHRAGDFDSSGSCSHVVLIEKGGEVRLGCGVDCEGGGIEVAMSKETNQPSSGSRASGSGRTTSRMTMPSRRWLRVPTTRFSASTTPIIASAPRW